METHNVREYKRLFLLSIHSCDPRRARQGGPPTAEETLNNERRQHKEDWLRACGVEIVPIHLPCGSTPQELYNLWATKLWDKTEEDLVFVFYRGWVCGKNEGYSG